MDRLLWFVFAGSRGGPTRIRIILCLLQSPMNRNQLAGALGLDYKTIEHNLRFLVKHRFAVCASPESYGAPYFPSKNLLASRADFDALAAKLRPDLGKGPSTSTTGVDPR